MSKEPVVISVPDTDGRYYLLPMLDMWTDVFASPGWRTTGSKAGTFLVTPPGWRPDLGDKFADELKLPKDTQRIEAPTPYVWIIGRTRPTAHLTMSGPQDPGRLQSLVAFGVRKNAEAGRGQDRSERRYEDPAQDPGRQHGGRSLFCLRCRVAQAPAAPHHRLAHHRTDEKDRNRAWPKLRYWQA